MEVGPPRREAPYATGVHGQHARYSGSQEKETFTRDRLGAGCAAGWLVCAANGCGQNVTDLHRRCSTFRICEFFQREEAPDRASVEARHCELSCLRVQRCAWERQRPGYNARDRSWRGGRDRAPGCALGLCSLVRESVCTVHAVSRPGWIRWGTASRDVRRMQTCELV